MTIHRQIEALQMASDLPNKFIPLQQCDGTVTHAACLDSDSHYYGWLMWKHPDGQWVTKRKLDNRELMQVEDQEYYGIVIEGKSKSVLDEIAGNPEPTVWNTIDKNTSSNR